MSSTSLQHTMPTNSLVRALLTDLYQITMSYAHWKIGKHDEDAVFEIFFRTNPFKGEYTIFCGLDECLKHIQSFAFTKDDIDYLKSTPSLAHCEAAFFDDYLLNLTTKDLRVYAIPEGTIVFPREPLVILEGPLGLGQLLETTLLNLVNYPSLIATNASRMVLRAGTAPCIEFGLRRAQGPDGACSASKYAFVGGFVGTSNVQAGKTFGIPITGTHAHAYVQAFASLEEVSSITLYNKKSQREETILPHVMKYRTMAVSDGVKTNDGELAAFCAYACSFPDNCLCLIDTYDTISSGLQNFIFVAKALDDFGYTPRGVRLDSGNLAELSYQCQLAFDRVIAEDPEGRTSAFGRLTIVASNDIDEGILVDLSNNPRNKITSFGIGTNLVTCQAQPALGCVYKMVEWAGKPRIKLSQDLPKVTIPGRKRVYRLYGQDGRPVADYMALASEAAPGVVMMTGSSASIADSVVDGGGNGGIVCCNPFDAQDRLLVQPSKVEQLHRLVFENGHCGQDIPSEDLSVTRGLVMDQLRNVFDESHTRYENPQPYKVTVSEELFRFLHELWEKEAP